MSTLNWRFLALAGVLFGVTAYLEVFTDADPRLVSAWFGFAAMAGLVYRLISTWPECVVLVHTLAICLVGFLLVGAIGSLQLSGMAGGSGNGIGHAAPLTVVSWPAVYLRVLCILIAVKWPRWANRRQSPLRKVPAETA